MYGHFNPDVSGSYPIPGNMNKKIKEGLKEKLNRILVKATSVIGQIGQISQLGSCQTFILLSVSHFSEISKCCVYSRVRNTQ